MRNDEDKPTDDEPPLPSTTEEPTQDDGETEVNVTNVNSDTSAPQPPTVETVNEDDEETQDDEGRPEDVIENDMIGLKYREEPILTDADKEECEAPIGDKSMYDLVMDHLRTENPTEPVSYTHLTLPTICSV